MLTINYLLIGTILVTMSLFIYLLYFSFNIFYFKKVPDSVKNKKRPINKRKTKQYRIRTEKILNRYQLIIGLILLLLLLITFIILKVELYSNQLSQSYYNVLNNQKQLEKKVNTQNKILNKYIQLETYPEDGLSSFKISNDKILQEIEQQRFIDQLTKELETLFLGCKITVDLNWDLKRLTLNLKENDAQLELKRQNRKELLKHFKLELANFNPIDQFLLKEFLFEKNQEETLYFKNTEGEFIEQEVSIDHSNNQIEIQDDDKK